MNIQDIIWISNASWYKVHCLDDYYMIFNHRSGDTHVLNFFSFTVLDYLSQHESKGPDLKEPLLEILGVEPSDISTSLLNSTLTLLDEAGLIEPSSLIKGIIPKAGV